MPRPWTRFSRFAGLGIALAGCGDSNEPITVGPPSAQVTAIGITTSGEVAASLDALTLPTTLAPTGTDEGEPTCATPSSTTDSDGDGIPDDATYAFTAPPCNLTFPGGSLELVGQVRVQDPAPSAAGFGYEATVTNLRFTFDGSGDGPAYTVTRNGLRALTGSPAALQLVADFQLTRTFVGELEAAVEQLWTVSFTPEASLQINQPLSSGTLDIAGSLDWTRGTESVSLTVTTPTPLHYNADCDGAQRIDAGELRAGGTFPEAAGYVRLLWNDCNDEPSVRFVPEGE